MMTRCIRCGYQYKTGGKNPFVYGCFRCNEPRFDNNTLKEILTDFKLGKI